MIGCTSATTLLRQPYCSSSNNRIVDEDDAEEAFEDEAAASLRVALEEESLGAAVEAALAEDAESAQ